MTTVYTETVVSQWCKMTASSSSSSVTYISTEAEGKDEWDKQCMRERERGWMNETDIITYQYMLYNNIETILTICLFDRDKQRHHETALLYRKYFKVCFLHSTAVLRSSFYFNPTSCLKDCSVLIISDMIKTVSGRCCSVHVTADPSRPT